MNLVEKQTVSLQAGGKLGMGECFVHPEHVTLRFLWWPALVRVGLAQRNLCSTKELFGLCLFYYY